MANIVINEISDNYTYNIGDNSFATVALPITASWGPAYLNPSSVGLTEDNAGFTSELDNIKWAHFPATRQGLDAFVSAYRGPSSLYKAHKDYSYQTAITLLASGYDVLVCRVCGGKSAVGYLKVAGTSETYPAGSEETWEGFLINAKYAGTFGNNLRVTITQAALSITQKYWNCIVSIVDSTGGVSAVENFNFVITEPVTGDLPDYILPIGEINSEFVDINCTSGLLDSTTFTTGTAKLGETAANKGTDDIGIEDTSTLSTEKTAVLNLVNVRYTAAGYTVSSEGPAYYKAVNDIPIVNDPAHNIVAVSMTDLLYWKHMEFNYTAAYYAFSLLRDKLQYNPQRIMAAGWDDQDIAVYNGAGFGSTVKPVVSPLHKAIMNAAYYGRCGAGLIDIPRSVPQSMVYNITAGSEGYAQLLAKETLPESALDKNAGLYVTHCALFAPWGQYKFIGMGRMTKASPSFLALMIQRAQILNQPIQYEWCLPTDRKHNLNIGKMDYEVNKATLDKWQKLEGVGVNVITPIPGLGTNLWGNSTLFNVPPATYQALANLSTRYLMNAVENVAYTVGLTITFQYNNDQAYSTFYAGVTPILDTMKNVGAIRDYRVQMSADINGEDHVNANTVIGKIYLVVEGVINDIVIDLVALPPTADLNQVVG